MAKKYDDGCRRGDPKLNSHLERTSNTSSQTHYTADPPPGGWPSMADLAKTFPREVKGGKHND